MLENYIDQIIKMEILADIITIIDDKGIIRYFRLIRDVDAPISFSDVVGRHFLDVYPDIDPEKSTVLKALRGEATVDEFQVMTNFRGTTGTCLESVYPIKLDNIIVGAVCISRGMERQLQAVEIRSRETRRRDRYTVNDFIGVSPALQELKLTIMKVAEHSANVLVCGETGTGKEMVAQAIHSFSRRKDREFCAQNCAAIPDTLMESLFFGTEKGAYTGAVSSAGILERANGGTLFLDEANSLNLSLQAKLLKALEEKRGRRLGAEKTFTSDFRVIAAMNEDPFACMKKGTIRRDLFYRLSSVIIEVPPLRRRPEDIMPLAEHFMDEYGRGENAHILGMTPAVREFLLQYAWPGNVRELKNVIESAMILAKGPVIDLPDLPAYLFASPGETEGGDDPVRPEAPVQEIPLYEDQTLRESVARFEASLLRYHLSRSGNHTELARKLGITRQTLLNKIRLYHLE